MKINILGKEADSQRVNRALSMVKLREFSHNRKLKLVIRDVDLLYNLLYCEPR